MPGCIADDEQRSPARKAAGPTYEIKFEGPLTRPIHVPAPPTVNRPGQPRRRKSPERAPEHAVAGGITEDPRTRG